MMRTVLVVDDVATNRIILKKILSSDYHVLEAQNGEEALLLLKKQYRSIAAVLLDIVMPVMDGYEVLMQMQTSTQLSQIPVIVTTGSSDRLAERKALMLGATDFVPKPYDADIILRRLTNLIKLRETAAMVNTLQKDRLTGLWNRETFFEKAAWEIARKPDGYYVLSSADIDNFKVVNDQFGTEKGDEVLKRLANMIRRFCEANASVCGRIGADYFVMLYPKKFADSGEISRRTSDAVESLGLPMPITISAGRYVVADRTLSVSAMFDRASLAQRRVKGRYDTHVGTYDESLRINLLREQEIVGNMTDALEKGQFEAWYQPQYNHATGALIGAEALARWRHPERGLIPPGEFVPVFERNGFIYELDKCIWEQVLKNHRQWIGEGRQPLPVSVNISRYDLFCDDLVDVLCGLVQKYDVPVELLRLEVTESAFAKSTDRVVAVVKKLIERGFTVEIDDFGSGYSSLNTLKDVPAQVLKLDMRFVENSDNADRGGNIIESVVRMAKWIGMSVIAEGVETAAQADYLKSIGCNYIQGYFYAKPMSKGDYEEHCKGAAKEEKLIALEQVKNLESISFWDPSSLDTLIFNSFVGAACIFEYAEDRIELIRATDKYPEVIGNPNLTVADALRIDWSEHIDEAGIKMLNEAVARSLEKQDEVTGEFIFNDLPGCPGKIYLRSTLRVIASVGERYLIYCTNENITAQHLAEQKEKELSYQLRVIMQNMNGGVSAITTDTDGKSRVIFANEKYYSILGYTREQFAKEVPDTMGLVVREDREHFKRMITEVMQYQTPLSYRFRCIRRDGEVVYLTCNASAFAMEGVSTPVRLSVVTDITDTVVAEKKEREAAERMQAIMDHVGSGITAVVAEGRQLEYIFANDRYYEILGYTREQFDREISNVYFLIAEEDREKVAEATELAKTTGETQQVNYRVMRRDGSEIWMRNLVSCTYFDGVALPVLLTIHTDITAERTAAEKLRITDERLRIIMNNVDDGISAATMDGSKAHYIFANRQFYSMLGYTEEEFNRELPDGLMDIIHPDDLPAASRTIEVNEQQRGTATTVFRVIRRDRSIMWMRANGTICSLEGFDKPVHIAVHSDITAERIAMEQLQSFEERMQAIMRNMDGGIAAYTFVDGRIKYLFTNKHYSSMFGYTKAQFFSELPNGIRDLIPEEDRAKIDEAIVSNESNLGVETVDFSVTCRDGKMIFVHAISSVCSMLGEEGPVHVTILRDITFEHETLERVRSLNENLTALMNDTPGGFARLRVLPDGAVAADFVNEPFCRLRGMTAGEIMAADGGNAMDTVHPDDLELVRGAIAKMIATGETCNMKYRLRRGDGAYVPLNVFARVTRNEKGETFINAYYAKLNEQERTEVSVQEMAPPALTAMMEDSPNIVFIKDADLKYVHCNRLMAESCGCSSPQEMIGKTDFDILDYATAEIYASADREILKTGKPLINFVSAIPMQDGSIRFERTTKHPLLDSLGNVIGVFGIGRDITADQSAFDRLKLLTDNIPGGIATFEASGETLKAKYYNDGFFNYTGYTREEFDAMFEKDPIGSVVLPEDAPLLKEALKALEQGAAERECQYRCRTKDGGVRWFRMRGEVQTRRGDRTVFNVVQFDITAQKVADEALRIREEEYRLAIEKSGKLIYRYFHSSNTIEMPKETARLFGLPTTRIKNVPDGILKKNIIAPESVGEYQAFYEAVARGDKTGEMTIRRKIAGGEWRWFEARFSTIFDDANKPVTSIVVFEDVTEARAEKIEETLDRNRFMAALNAIYPVIISVNLTKDTYQLVSTGGDLSMLNKREGTIEEMVLSAAERMEHDYAEHFVRQFQKDNLITVFSDVGDSLRLEYRQHGAGRQKPRWAEIIVIRTPNDYNTDVTGVVVGRYIDTQKNIEDRLKLAEIDGMTGLLNKTTTEERIARRLAENGGTCALLIADLDGLKAINDTLGHDQGDVAIKQMANLLRGQFRQSDIVGRVGGDEFAAYLSDITKARVNSIMLAFMRKMSTLRIGPKNDIVLRGSIGIVMGTPGVDTYETLFKRADKALYHVKRNGKDDFAFYTPDMEKSTYRYAVESTESKWQESLFDVEELDYLLSAVSAVYPMVISVNLTQNSYYMLQYDRYYTHDSLNAGKFDDLIATGAGSFHPDDREAFLKTFSRESLLAAYARGETMVCTVGRQRGDDGKYRRIRTDAIFVKSKDSDDVLEITLARENGEG